MLSVQPRGKLPDKMVSLSPGLLIMPSRLLSLDKSGLPSFQTRHLHSKKPRFERQKSWGRLPTLSCMPCDAAPPTSIFPVRVATATGPRAVPEAPGTPDDLSVLSNAVLYPPNPYLLELKEVRPSSAALPSAKHGAATTSSFRTVS